MYNYSHSTVRCGIILAAGEGRRLQPFIRRLHGKDLPKQYVNFTGKRSMLEHTIHRAEKLIPSRRLFTVVGRHHLCHPEVDRQLAERPGGRVILQPRNKETGPGLLLPLMHLYKHYPESIVVVFPSDHFVLEEDLFMGHVDLALRAVERDPSRLVLLGVEPVGPEPEYGYILPIRPRRLRRRVVYEVSRFVEKPEARFARTLIRRGGLWNTMVIAFNAKTFLELACRVAPILHRSFQKILGAIGTPLEGKVVEEVYRALEPVNFSKGLLEALSAQYSSHLGVLPIQGVRWSDWGSEGRIESILQTMNPMADLLERRTARSPMIMSGSAQVNLVPKTG